MCLMHPGGRTSERAPPTWDPVNQASCPFRDWGHEAVIWTIASPLDERRKAVAATRQLRGAAKRLLSTVPPAVWTGGGLIGGRRVGPMTYLMTILAQNFGELGEETALKAAFDLTRFQGRPGENVDALLARFDEVSARAPEDGKLRLNTPSCSGHNPICSRRRGRPVSATV